MKKAITALFISYAITQIFYGQGWNPICTTYASWGYDHGTSSVIDGDYVYITGDSYIPSASIFQPEIWSIKTIKYSISCGSPIWTATYSSSSHTFVPNDIKIDESGNVYVLGTRYDVTNGEDIILIKYDSNGDELWVETYHDNGNDRGNAMILDGDGNIYVTGTSRTTANSEHSNNEDIIAIKYESDSDISWVRWFNGLGNGSDEAMCISIDIVDRSKENGAPPGIYVGGWAENGNNCPPPSGPCYHDAQIVHWLLDGNTWDDDNESHYGCDPQNHDFINDIAVSTETGVVYTVGSKWCLEDQEPFFYEDPAYEMFIFESHWDGHGFYYEENVCSNSRYIYNEGSSSIGNSLIVTTENDEDVIYATGYSGGESFVPDFLTIKYSNLGVKIWEKRYDSGGADWGNSYIGINSSYVFIAGRSGGIDVANITTIQYNRSNGNQICVATFNGSSNDGDQPNSLSVQGSNIFIGGFANQEWPEYDESDFILLKYGEQSNCNEEEDKISSDSKEVYSLNQNYPNPFNPSTTISYSISKATFVSLKIYNLLGQIVHEFPSKYLESGKYSEFVDATNWASGIYFYQIQAIDPVNNLIDFEAVQKMLLIK